MWVCAVRPQARAFFVRGIEAARGDRAEAQKIGVAFFTGWQKWRSEDPSGKGSRRMRTIDGLQTILLGEPQSVHNFPALYGAYERFTRPLRNARRAAQPARHGSQLILRLVIPVGRQPAG